MWSRHGLKLFRLSWSFLFAASYLSRGEGGVLLLPPPLKVTGLARTSDTAYAGNWAVTFCKSRTRKRSGEALANVRSDGGIIHDCIILRRSLVEVRMRKCSQQRFGIARSFRLARAQVAGRVLQDGSGSGGGDAPIVVIGSDTIVDVRVGDVGGLRHTL